MSFTEFSAQIHVDNGEGAAVKGRCCSRAFLTSNFQGALPLLLGSHDQNNPNPLSLSLHSRNTAAAFWLRKYRATLDSCCRSPVMRYDNWDVILFPEGSNIPIPEYRTACYLSRDEGEHLGSNVSFWAIRVDGVELTSARWPRTTDTSNVHWVAEAKHAFSYLVTSLGSTKAVAFGAGETTTVQDGRHLHCSGHHRRDQAVVSIILRAPPGCRAFPTNKTKPWKLRTEQCITARDWYVSHV